MERLLRRRASGTIAARMMGATAGSDAEGAWPWRLAYDVVQAAAILADRAAARGVDPLAPPPPTPWPGWPRR